jgi:sulfonate transport system substrate-binding protein
MKRIGLALVVAVVVVAAQARAGDIVVRIGWLRAANDLTLAKEHGSLERALAPLGARVEWDGPFAAAAPAIEAMAGDAVDITAAGSTAAVAALSARAPVVLFAYQRMAPAAEAILVAADGPIRSVADLVGRSVAVNRGGTGEYLLSRALATHGIEAGRVRPVYLGPADAGPAFAAGAVDALAAWDPFLAVAQGIYHARVLADGGDIGSRNAVVMLVRKGFAEEHRDLLRAVYEALMAENRWAVGHPQEAGVVWARALGVPESLAPAFARADAVPAGPVGPAQVAEIESVGAWYAAAGIAENRGDVAASCIDFSH